MSRRNAVLASSAVACLVLLSANDVGAEEIEHKFRLALSVGGFSASDSQHSPSGNRRALLLPDGTLKDRIFDPRNDAAAISDFGLEPQRGGVFSASYSLSRLWFVEASVGYRRGRIGNVEVQAQFDGIPIPNLQRFNFEVFNLDGGTLTQIPVQLTAGIRFRPKASFNPYLGAGVGYSFNSFEPSDELNQLSRDLDQSTGGFSRLTGTQLSGEDLLPAATTQNLSGIKVDAPNAPEWHFGGGFEYSFKRRWAVFLDARYMVYSGRFHMTVNGSDELGISVPNDQVVNTEPGAFGPFGAFSITRGGLIDGGSLVPVFGAPPGTNCAVSTVNCELTGPKDGINDTGKYYVHAGSVRYNGAAFQIGFKFTF